MAFIATRLMGVGLLLVLTKAYEHFIFLRFLLETFLNKKNHKNCQPSSHKRRCASLTRPWKKGVEKWAACASQTENVTYVMSYDVDCE